MTTKEDFETRLAVVGKNIDALVSDTREEYMQERRELKDKWEKLEARRSEIAAKGDSAWEELKDEMTVEWEDLRISYENLGKRFRK